MLIELDNQPAAEIYSQETDLPAKLSVKIRASRSS